MVFFCSRREVLGTLLPASIGSILPPSKHDRNDQKSLVTIVNPDGLRNQMMGAVVQAIGGALFEAIQFKDGCILNPHLPEYRVPRFSDTPEIDVVLIDRKDLPSAGAGETGIVGLAPAISNANFSATGTRLHDMPMAMGRDLKG